MTGAACKAAECLQAAASLAMERKENTYSGLHSKTPVFSDKDHRQVAKACSVFIDTLVNIPAYKEVGKKNE